MNKNKLGILIVLILLISMPQVFGAVSGLTIKGKIIREVDGTNVNNASVTVFSTANIALTGSFPLCVDLCKLNSPAFTGSDGLYATSSSNLVHIDGTSGCILGDKNQGDNCEGEISSASDFLYINISGAGVIPNALGDNVTNTTTTWDAQFVSGESANVVNGSLPDLPPEANIILTKSDNPDPVENATLLNYTLTVNSTGPQQAINVVVVDTFPANVTFVSSSPIADSGTNNTFSLGNVSNGSILTINITVLVNESVDSSILTNVVNVTYQDVDGRNLTDSDIELTTTFGVDQIAPSLFDVRPIANTTFNASEIIAISANVTDVVGVDTVLANITFPNSTTQLLTLSQTGGTDKFNNTFSIPPLLGQYNVSFFANDTSNNINGTETTFFVSVDSVPPIVFDLIPASGTNFNVSDIIQIAANVTDNVAVDTVLANITFPNSTTQLLTFSQITSTDKYNNSFTIPVLTGQYNVTVIANDTEGNVNSTETTFFVGADSVSPLLFDLIPVASSTFNVTDVIEIGANVTDNIGVDKVQANITFPDSTLQSINLSSATGDKFNNSFIIPNITGQYNVTFIANDSSNNLNTTETTFFVGVDGIPPTVRNVTPTAGSIFNVSDVINISANVNDETAVDTVLVNITLPNASTIVSTLTNTTAELFNTSFTIPNVTGQYILTFIANDTSNNLNTTETSFFVGEDNTPPEVFAINPGSGISVSTNSSLEISTNVTDNVAVDTVVANVSLPNTTLQVLFLTRVIGTDKFNVSFSPPLTGLYNVTFIANDTSNNINNTETTNFTSAQDTDNDGIPDNNDTLIGDEDFVKTTGVNNLNITVEGGTVLGTFLGVKELVFSDGTKLLINFTHNFSIGNPINLNLISITVNTNSIVVNVSGQLLPGEKKIIALTDNNFISLCAKDQEITTADEITSSCTGANETDFTICLGNSTGVTITNRTCVDTGSLIRIANLSFSGISGSPAAVAAAPGGGGRGGGGGGGLRIKECGDGFDNDNDGKIDMADPDCITPADDQEKGDGICISSWSCTSWSTCDNNTQTRICSDMRECVPERIDARSCIVQKEEPIVESPSVIEAVEDKKPSFLPYLFLIAITSCIVYALLPKRGKRHTKKAILFILEKGAQVEDRIRGNLAMRKIQRSAQLRQKDIWNKRRKPIPIKNIMIGIADIVLIILSVLETILFNFGKLLGSILFGGLGALEMVFFTGGKWIIYGILTILSVIEIAVIAFSKGMVSVFKEVKKRKPMEKQKIMEELDQIEQDNMISQLKRAHEESHSVQASAEEKEPEDISLPVLIELPPQLALKPVKLPPPPAPKPMKFSPKPKTGRSASLQKDINKLSKLMHAKKPKKIEFPE